MTVTAIRARTLLKLTSAIAAATVGVSCLAGAAGAATITKTYTEDFGAAIANPERGFYRHQGDCDRDAFNEATLRSWRVNGSKGVKSNLVMCLFYLADFKTSPISDSQLSFFDQQADTVRRAGLKMIVRFAYTKSSAGDDAEPARVQAHLNQLAWHLQTNADVIAIMQSGFVGAFGEGWSTQHFGNEGDVDSVDWVHRNDIVRKLLDILPANRKVQVRTREMKQQLFGTTLATPGDVSAQQPIGRVGYHDDCFLGAYGDQGTYHNAAERSELISETSVVPIGGESCGAIQAPRGECPNALAELGTFRFSFLNRDWGPITETWGPAGCLDDMDRRLGYRFALKSFSSSTSVARGTKLPFKLEVRNSGWASTMNHRPVLLVLRHATTMKVHRFQVWNTRFWTPGMTHTLNHPGISIPSTMPTGTYDVLLSAPDPATAPAVPGGIPLSKRPEYAIKFANTGGLWEPETGFNRLLQTVDVH